jgi:hypothetical protein
MLQALRDFISGPNKTGTILSVAQIHATIVAILFGFLSLYIYNSHACLREMTSSLLDEARRANDINFNVTIGHPFRMLPNRDVSDGSARKSLVNSVQKLLESMLKSAGNIEARGQEVVNVLWLLSQNYPFYASQKVMGIGKGGVHYQRGRPLVFDNVQSVETWMKDAKELTQPLLSLVAKHAAKIDESVTAYAADRQEANENSMLDSMALALLRVFPSNAGSTGAKRDYSRMKKQYSDANDPTIFVISFFQNIQQVDSLVADLQDDLKDVKEQHTILSQYRVSAWWIIGAFFIGVCLPLFIPVIPLSQLGRDVCSMLVLVIPLVFYFVIIFRCFD